MGGMDRTVKTRGHEDYELQTNSRRKNCVLCIGPKKSGKSQVISSLTQNKDIMGAEDSRLCEFYPSKSPGPIYVEIQIDWEDQTLNIERVKKKLVECLENQGVDSILAVLWHIIPNYQKGDIALNKQVYHKQDITCRQ